MSLPAPISIETLIDALTCGSLTILPNAIAARNVRQLYDTAQRARNLQAWEPAPILSWTQFLDHLWSEAIVSGAENRLLLNEAQEHSLWVDIVSNGEATLTSADSLADLAHKAWTLASAYNAAGRLRATANTHDTITFANWAEAFTRACERNRYLSRAALELALAHHIGTGDLAAPPTLTLTGFAGLTPAQTTLLEALDNAGTIVTEHALDVSPSPDSIRAVFAAPGEQDELRSAAHWIRTFLQQHPVGRVGVILPDPDDAATLEATFRDVLAPELQSIGADLSSTPWEFPAGTPLTSLPLISTALDLAHWAHSALELGKVSGLLLSPYLGAPTERDNTAQFDARILRRARLLRPEIDLPSLIQLAQTSPLAPAWLKPLHQFLTKSPNLDTPRTFSDWAEFLRSLIASTGFPGVRTLTSLEYHATQAWDSLLDQLSTLDFHGRRVPYSIFLHTLTRQANAAAFTPPSTNAPVQVLSPAAATGLTFDALVLTRATDANYPPAERTNPLLSFALQASLEMPGTTQPRDMASLLNLATNILATYTPQTSEGAQHLAPMLANLSWPEVVPEPGAPSHPLKKIFIADSEPLPPLPTTEVEGGARVLKLQAACGFLAFSELRLHSTELDTQLPGFDALESGNFLHRALQSFWAEVGSQQNLRNMSAGERDHLITRCVDQAVSHKLRIETRWDAAYLDLQKERLRTVLRRWTEAELERGPFEVIGLEQQAEVEAGPLTLSVRVDRIDRVTGGHLFVDYKTGASANPSQWEDARPEEPQLPLYALLSQPGELKGVAFAKVRAGKGMSWQGYQSDPGILPMKRPRTVDLDLAIETWRTTLASLAQDFASGVADVNPKDFAVNCTRCTQRLLCRINPESFLANEDAEAEQTGDDAE